MPSKMSKFSSPCQQSTDIANDLALGGELRFLMAIQAIRIACPSPLVSAWDSVSRLCLKIAENQWTLVEFLRFLVRVLLLFTIGNLKIFPTKNGFFSATKFSTRKNQYFLWNFFCHQSHNQYFVTTHFQLRTPSACTWKLKAKKVLVFLEGIPCICYPP